LLIGWHRQASGQPVVDSLLRVLATAKDDPTRCTALSSLAYYYQRTDVLKSAKYNDQAMQIALRSENLKLLAMAWFDRSSIRKYKGNFDEALRCISKASGYYTLLHDTSMMAECLSEEGVLYNLKNEPVTALGFFLQAEKLIKVADKPQSLSKLYNSLGTHFLSQKQYQKALEYYNKSLKINTEVEFSLGVSVNLVNIGNVYFAMKDYPNTIEYNQRALRIKESIHDRQGIQ
jgi:tetratricopeptide (TPR) repeat protein